MAETTVSDPAYAYHFVPADMKLAHSSEPVELGRTYRVAPPIIPCERGLHGSIRLLDALSYSSSSNLTRCAYAGQIVHQNDKLAASERTVLWIGDIEPILHEAACVFAEGALRVAKVTDPRLWAAIEAKRKWLRGEITDKELAATRAAAWAAERAAAWDAERAATRAAARAAASAAWAATRAAARDAAWDAERAAAWAATRDAAWAAERAAAWAATRAAARDAAWVAERAAQNDWLECAVRHFAGVD